MKLSTLNDQTRKPKRFKRVGRGIGSGKGKTCARGQKGSGARAGYKRRWGYEGGQMRLHMKLPRRGFSNARFKKMIEAVNLYHIEQHFDDGDTVDLATLKDKGLVSTHCCHVKILGDGEITKKVNFSVQSLSDKAKEKLQNANIPFTIKE